MKKLFLTFFAFMPIMAMASEADLKVPNLGEGYNLLLWGMFILILGIAFGISQFMYIKKLPAHESMLHISQTI